MTLNGRVRTTTCVLRTEQVKREIVGVGFIYFYEYSLYKSVLQIIIQILEIKKVTKLSLATTCISYLKLINPRRLFCKSKLQSSTLVHQEIIQITEQHIKRYIFHKKYKSKVFTKRVLQEMRYIDRKQTEKEILFCRQVFFS